MVSEWLCEYLSTAPPRLILCSAVDSPLLIFTDGASEADGVTVGAVLLEEGFAPETFGEVVPGSVVAAWRGPGSWQVIGQAELAPVVLSARLWSSMIAGRHLIVFLDQHAARLGLIKAFSPSEASAGIIDVAMHRLASSCTYPWFTRVASASNPADVPSRLMWDALKDLFPDIVKCCLPSGAWAWA